MLNRKTLTKTMLAGVLALGALGGAATAADASDFRFSISTGHGTFVVGPSHRNGRFFHNAPRQQQIRHRHVQPVYQLRPRQARRVLRRAGFRDIQFVRERPRAYVFEARGWRGYRRVAVDKFTGQIRWRGGRG